jgi:hypothetical protein
MRKIGCMYKKTIDCIKIYLQEYLEEKKILREAALLAKNLGVDLSEILADNGTK